MIVKELNLLLLLATVAVLPPCVRSFYPPSHLSSCSSTPTLQQTQIPDCLPRDSAIECPISPRLVRVKSKSQIKYKAHGTL